MPIFDVAGPDGKTYQFEAPEGTSQKAIDRVARNYFRDQEIESLSKPEVTNTSTPTPKDETTLGGHIKEIGKGLGSGAVGLLQTAGTGIAALLPEETEQEVRRGIEGFTKPIQQELAPAKGYEETVSRKLSEGVGSSIPFFALAPLGPAGRALGAGLGIAAGAGEARERAEKGGASPEDKRTATLLGGATGIFDMLAPGVGHAAEGVIKRAFLSGGVEGATEAAQQISQNIIAQKLYKPGQDIFEDVGPSAGYGGGAGFLTSLLLDVALPGRTRGAKTTTAPGATPPETTQVGKQFDDEATAQAAQRPEEFYGPQKPEDFIGPIAPPRPEEFIGPSPIPNQENFIGPQPKPEFVGPEAPTPEQYTASPDFVGPQLRQGIAPRTGADVLSFQRENVTQPAMNASGQNTNAFVGPPAPAYPALSKEDLGMGAFVPSSQQFVGPLPQKLTPEQLEQEKKGLNFFQPSGYEAALRGAGNTLNFTPTPTGNISAPKAFVGPSPIPNPENFIGPSPRPIGYKTKVESYVEAQNRIALEKAKATREAREQAHAENEEQAKHADYIAKLKFENELAALQAERNQKQNKTQEDRRLEVLHPILSDPKITNIPKAFARALETAGMNPGAFSVRERNLIAKAYDVRGATIETTTKRNMEPGVEQEYAAPNELELEGKPAAEVSQPSLEGFGKQQTKKPGAKAAPEEVAIVEEPLNEPIVSAQSVTNLGFPKKAPIRAKLEGKDLTDPVQREEVRTALKEFLFSGAVGPKSNLYKNISTALKNSPFLQTQKEMTGKGFNITKALLKGKKEPKTKSEEAEPAASKTTKPAKETENDSQGATVEPTIDTGTSEQGVGVGGVGVGSTSTQSEDTGGISETTDRGLGSTGVRAESTTKTEQPESETLETEVKEEFAQEGNVPSRVTLLLGEANKLSKLLEAKGQVASDDPLVRALIAVSNPLRRNDKEEQLHALNYGKQNNRPDIREEARANLKKLDETPKTQAEINQERQAAQKAAAAPIDTTIDWDFVNKELKRLKTKVANAERAESKAENAVASKAAKEKLAKANAEFDAFIAKWNPIINAAADETIAKSESQAAAAKTKPATVSFEEARGKGIAYNDSVLAGLRTIAEEDNIADDHPNRVGAVMLTGIDRQAGGAKGRASELLKGITDWADTNGKTIVLMPSGSIEGSRENLVSWYERNGFVQDNDGAMVRQPKAEKKPAGKPAKGKNKPTASVAVEPEIINQEWEETTTPEDKAFVKATSAAYTNLDPEDIGKARDTDRRKIGSLLKGPTRTKGENSGQLKAAKTYFSKMSRLVDNLHNMAFDFAFGMPQFRVQDKGVSAAEAKFFSGTGAKSAEQAIAWVRANLSPEVNAKLDALIEDYKASKANHTESFIENLIGQDSTTQGYYDATVNEWVKDGGLSLEKNSVNRLSFPLHPAVRGMLMQGNLAGALNIHAGLTSGIESRISSLLATGVKDVKVEIFDNLTDENGKSVAGYYDPATNTVRLDSVSGMNSHAVLHEVTHSALAKVLSNPAHPVTKQLTALYEQTKPFLSSAYGSQSLQEFVAEAWGNPEFRDNLAAINPDGTKITSWQRFKNIVGNWLRRIVGLENKTIESAFDRADRLMSAIIDPNNSGLDVTDIFAADNKGDGAHIVDNMGKLYLKTDGFTETTADRAIDAVATLPSTGKKVVLASMPTNGLIAMAKKVMGGFNIGRFNELINQHSGAMNRRKQALDVEVRALRDWESKAKKADVKRLNDVVYQSTIHEVDPEKDYNHYLIRAAEAQTAADALNAKAKTLQGKEKSVALADAKAAQKRADRYRESTKKYADITAAWKQLGADGQAQYRRMRDTYKKLNDEVGIQLGVRVGEELGESDSAKAMNKALKRLFERKGFIDPYFPLTREGDFKLSYNMKTEDGTSTEPYVEQFKTKTARERRIKELTEQGAADIERFSSMRELNYRSAPSASFISDVVDTLKVGGASEQTIDNIMRVYLQTLPETSLAQAFQHRENRLGFDQDAVGAFKKKTLSIASQLTNMEYGAKMNLYKKEMLQHFKGMRGDAAEKALPFVNEFSKRMDIAFNQHVSKWAQATTGVGFLYTLGGNISSALVNVAQVPLVVTPYLGGEYGYSNTTTALGHAARMYMSTGVSRKAKGFLEDTETTVNAMPSLGNIDFANPKLSPAMKQLETAVEIWADNGQLNRSIAYDILNADKEDSLLTKTNRTLGWTFHQGERMNREVTLIAAYNLELKRMEKNGRAIDKAAMTEAANKAIDMTELTHGGTTSASTPRILQSDLGKVLGMYKRYGAQMYYLQFKTLFDAVKGASPEERAIALRQGVGIFASTTLISGLRNAPMIGVIAMLYNMFRDDDDDTFNESMRKYVGDFAYGGAVNHYLNIQFGTRASMTDLIYHEGLNDAEKSKGQLALEQLGGVLYGTEQRVERGLKLMMQGEITRGAEQMAPAFIGNAIKAARYATEGTQTVRGDPITGPVNDGSVFAQAIGFAPADYNRQLEINSNWTNIQKAIVTKKTELQRQYFVAMRQGDSSGARETLEKIQEFNKKHPTIAITGESLMASLKQNFKTSAMMQHGIVVNPRLRAAFMQNMAEYDSDD